MFAGKTALITGGGSGIGRSLALALAKEGARVAVADLREETARSVADEITAVGGRSIAIGCDVSDHDAVLEMKARANAAFGTVSFLFANAGATTLAKVTELSRQDFAWIVGVNLFGVANCVQAFVPEMVAQKSGHVVATSSMAGLLPGWMSMQVPYSTSKAGVIGMMFNLRWELAQQGVGATVLCPGGVITNIFAAETYRPSRFGAQKDATISAAPADLKFAAPMGPPRQPDEVAQMTLEAVRKNRAVVVTDPAMRECFQRTYADEVMLAFDDVDAFDRRQTAKN